MYANELPDGTIFLGAFRRLERPVTGIKRPSVIYLPKLQRWHPKEPEAWYVYDVLGYEATLEEIKTQVRKEQFGEQPTI